jgi:hypothetical protein
MAPLKDHNSFDVVEFSFEIVEVAAAAIGIRGSGADGIGANVTGVAKLGACDEALVVGIVLMGARNSSSGLAL